MAAVLVAAATLISSCTGRGAVAPSALPSSGPYATTPNIVFVLTDDLSENLVPYMPHVLALQRSGMSFTNYSVTDSLCCPSRSSIFTGEFPHNTKVFTNVFPSGGEAAYHAAGDEKKSFAPALQRAGYRTAFMGKYLNQYRVGADMSDGRPGNYIPPGWTTWDAGSGAYRNYDYNLNENGNIVHYGHQPQDFLTNVIARRGAGFIRRSVRARKPFLLELATYSPHHPFTMAAQDKGTFPKLDLPACSVLRQASDESAGLAGQDQADPRGRAAAVHQGVPQTGGGCAVRRPRNRPVGAPAAAHRATEQHGLRLQLRQRPPHGGARAGRR